MQVKEIFVSTLTKWESTLLDFNGESDHVHLIIDYKPDIALSKLIANLKTVSSRLIRKEFPDLAAKYFDNKPYFWFWLSSCRDRFKFMLIMAARQQNTLGKFSM